MNEQSIFISFKFGDRDAESLRRLCGEIVTRLGRISVFDGTVLPLRTEFSPEIAAFIRKAAACTLAIFVDGDHRNINVVYEVGVAVGAEKDVVLVAEKMEFIPSMLAARDVILFDRTALDWQVQLSRRLEYKLRAIFQPEGDHRIEEKIRTRYTPDELRNFREGSRLAALVETLRTSNLDKAESIAEARLKTDPKNPDYHFIYSDISYLRGCVASHPDVAASHFARQLETADSGLSVEPRSVNLLSSRARALIRLGRPALAREALETLLQIDRNYSIGHYDLACYAALYGSEAEMLRSLAEAIRLFPEWSDFAKGDPDFADYRESSAWRALVYTD